MWIMCEAGQVIKAESIVSVGIDGGLNIYAVLQHGKATRVRTRKEGETGEDVTKLMTAFIEKLGLGGVFSFDDL